MRCARDDVALVDLIKAGHRGLARAAEKYDPTNGYSFEAYATWFIGGAISKAAGPGRTRNRDKKGGTERV